MKQLYRCLLGVCFMAICVAAHAGAVKRLSDFFIENGGQVKNLKGIEADNVLFYKGGPMQLFITTTGYSVVTKTRGSVYNQVDFNFENAQIRKEQIIYVSDNTPAINIYSGHKALTALKTTQTVIIKDIYPGIDWVWSIDRKGNVRHDFMVNIGADASVIKYTVKGADVDSKAGMLFYGNKNLRVKEGPVVFQTSSKDIAGRVNIAGNSISYQLTDELKKGGFTIDPPLALDWSAGLDTASLSEFRNIAADSVLNTFTVGYSRDFTLPTFSQIPGSYVISNPAGGTDAVIMKATPQQDLLWVTFVGGSGDDIANSVAVTPTGIFVTGYSESWDFPQAVIGNYNQPVSLFNRDAFIIKFSNNGLLKWSTGYGGGRGDEGLGIKYFDGRVFVCGYTRSPNFPVMAAAGAYNYQDTLLYQADGFLLEFDTSGNRNWATCFGGSGNDYLSSLSVDSTGIYIAGYSDSTYGAYIPLVANGSAYFQNTFQTTESFLIRFNNSRALDWSTYFGGSGHDVATCILHNSCGLLVCGKTDGPGLPVINNSAGAYYQPVYAGGGSDGFIADFDPVTLQKTYCSYYGSAGYDALTGFDADTACNAVFTGFSNGNLTVTGDTLIYFQQSRINGTGFDGIMLAMDNRHHLDWASYFGSSRNDFGSSVAIISLPVVDMVGTGFYNYGYDTIGGTFLSDVITGDIFPDATTNGVSIRFNEKWIGGGTGGCGGDLKFQSLIPHRNTCANQCSGWSSVKLDHVGGCPPISSLWSTGVTGLFDTTLCTMYWNTIVDRNFQHRTIYGKFNVLKVPPSGPIRTHCGIYPDWSQYIHPEGGGAPYTFTLRGLSRDSCPNTAYFNISDTAGCTVSYSVEWYESNSNVRTVLNANNCFLAATTSFGSDCPDYSNASNWNYYIIKPKGDTVVVPFSNYGQNVKIPLDSFAGGLYKGYLDMGDCKAPIDNFVWFPPPNIVVGFEPGCNGIPPTVVIHLTADQGVINYMGGGYSIYLQRDNQIDAPGIVVLSNGQTVDTTANFTDTIFVTGDTIIRLPVIFYNIETGVIDPHPFDSAHFHYTAGVIQNITYENCGNTLFGIWVKEKYISVGPKAVYCGAPDTLFAFPVNAPGPFTYIWDPPFSTDSMLVATNPGVYSVRGFDSSGCQLYPLDSVTIYPKLIDSVSENLTPCDASPFSKAVAVARGGAPAYTYQWSDGETGDHVQYLYPGNAWVKVTDRHGCVDSTAFTVTKALPMQVNDSVNNPLCRHANNGSVAIKVSGGYPPYQIHWSNGFIGFNPAGLRAGTYAFTITDSRSCTLQSQAILTDPDSIVYVIGNITEPVCSQNNGNVTVSALGGTGSLNILWSDGSRNFIHTNLSAGTYIFTITDAHACTARGLVKVDSVQTLYAQVYPTAPKCYGLQNGSAEVAVFSSQGAVTFQWSNNGSLNAALDTGLAGDAAYSVTATDAAGCKFQSYFYIPAGDALYWQEVLEEDAFCGKNNGLVQIVGIAGVPPYQYVWGCCGNSNPISNVYAGNYIFTVTDANNCSVTGSVEVGSLSHNWDFQFFSGNTCKGDSSGMAQVKSPDYLSYSFLWSTGESADEIHNLPVGYYAVTITDNSWGCDTIIPFHVTASSSTLTVWHETSGILCSGQGADVYVFSSGGVPPYIGQHTYSNLLAGTYYFTIYDQTGCGVTDTLTLTQPPVMFNWVNLAAASCTGVKGVLAIQTYGGTPPYVATCNGVVHNYNNLDTMLLPAGTYTLTIRDSFGCTVNRTVVIPDDGGVQALVHGYDNQCNGGATGYATVSILNGLEPLNYYWSNGDSVNNNIQNLVAGTYSVTITDARGCAYDTAFVVNQPDSALLLTVDTGSGIRCYGQGDAVEVFASGGSGNYTGTGTYYFYAGTNYITVRDDAGCVVMDTVTLWQPKAMNAMINTMAPGCGHAMAAIGINVTGGSAPYSIQFNDSLYVFYNYTVISDVLPGAYQLTISDSNSCLYTPPSITVSDSVQTAIAAINGTNPTCRGSNNGSVTITALDQSSFLYVNGILFGGSYTFNNLAQGDYSFTVTTANGVCSNTLQTALFDPPQLTADYSIQQNVFCSGDQGSILITAAGGVPPYQGIGQFNVFGGNYNFVVTDNNGCRADLSVELNNPMPITASLNIIEPVICAGDSAIVNITASGGYAPYLGTGGAQYPAGNQYLLITDAYGCQYPFNFTIPAPDSLLVSYSILAQPGCSTNGNVIISAMGGSGPYQLINNWGASAFSDTIQQALPSGSYTMQVRDNLGCIQNLSFALTSVNSLSAGITGSNPSCYGNNNGSVNMTISGGMAPFFVNGRRYDTTTILIDSLFAGNYTFRLTDSTGCLLKLAAVIEQPSALVLDTDIVNTGVSCAGRQDATIKINVSGGTPVYNYKLYNATGWQLIQSANTFTNLAPGVYYIIVRDANNCTDSTQVNIPGFTPYNDSVKIENTPCYGGSNGAIKIYPVPDGNGPFTYSINGGPAQAYNVFYNLAAGAYQVIVNDANNCADTLSVSVTQPDSIDGRVWLNGVLLPLDSMVITNRDFAYFTKLNHNPWSVTFSPAMQYAVNTDSMVSVQPSEDITYTVTVYMDSVDRSCFVQYTGLIEVQQLPDLPNTITPNGDGFNDVWKIDLNKYPGSEVTIFDRWGEVVFTSTSYNNDWDGTNQKTGKHLPDGTYFYLLKAPAQKNTVYKGDINIVDAPR